MKIISTEAFVKDLALKRPYTIARNTFSKVEIVFFVVTLENGLKGYGASSTDVEVVGEDSGDTLKNLLTAEVLQLAGQDIRQFLFLIERCRLKFDKYPGTMSAIDIALHDAFGQFLGIPVVDFYGSVHQKLLTSVTIGIKGVDETLEEADEYFGSGFRALKVKTGINAELDAERVLKLREKFGSDFLLRVDANTGYDVQQLEKFISATIDASVELIEQPFLPEMDNELVRFSPDVRSRLAADESLKGPASALELARLQHYGIFNIKLMKCGGIRSALDISSITRHANIQLFWGCNDESVISIAAALHAAFSCAHTRYIDLDGSFDLAEDLVEGGFILKDGYLFPNDKPGLGLSLVNQY